MPWNEHYFQESSLDSLGFYHIVEEAEGQSQDWKEEFDKQSFWTNKKRIKEYTFITTLKPSMRQHLCCFCSNDTSKPTSICLFVYIYHDNDYLMVEKIFSLFKKVNNELKVILILLPPWFEKCSQRITMQINEHILYTTSDELKNKIQ